jgi:hypothetical protein
VIPKGYLYSTLAFYLFIEFINMRFHKRTLSIVSDEVKDESED